jgi:hypothetical protein
VGINQTAATNLLDIKCGANSDQGLQIKNSNADVSSLLSGEGLYYSRLQMKDTQTGYTRLQLSTRPGVHDYMMDNNLGIGTTTPGTLLQLEGSAPYLTLKNDTSENSDGGCESRIIFEDHANVSLARIQGSHDGSSDDTKGDLVFSTHDGTSLTEALRLDSSQKATFAAGFAVGSDAAGDILYHNGTSYVRLAKGTADQVLTMNDAATAPNWETASGGGGSDSWIAETRGNFTATLQANKYYYNGLIGYNAGVLAISISDTALATMGAKTLMQKAMMGVIPVNADLTEWKLTGFKDAGGSSNAVYDVNADIQLWKVSAYSNGTDVTDPTLTNIWDFTIDVDGDQLFTYGGTLSSGNSFSAGDGWFITVSRDSSGSAPYADHYWHLALKFEPS